ncbi:hypothetical protein jhhlp_004350 [Lomentospora prolificans]|uniref:Uncharacterized protein n=1 Tax=Lomentospora prolificans TaxID=41688 RepID=A0A2N3NBC2_9PEZI|nr:hypothetical protein jhhlp_004350 [Lomentospora prolificans]
MNGVMRKMSQALLQHKSRQKDSRKSAEFLARFREQQRNMNEELTEYIQTKTAEIEKSTSAVAKAVDTTCSKLSELLESRPGSSSSAEAHPLFKQGQETIAFCQQILKQYEDANNLIQGEKYVSIAVSLDEDRQQILEIIDIAAKFGEVAVNGVFCASSDNHGGLHISEPKDDKEKLAQSFFKESLAILGNKSWGEDAWSLFKAWHGVSKVVNMSDKTSASARE